MNIGKPLPFDSGRGFLFPVYSRCERYCPYWQPASGAQAHEWIGMGMTVLVIIHQILNRRGYGAIFKGRYTAYRILSTAVNLLLLLSFLLTAFPAGNSQGFGSAGRFGQSLTTIAWPAPDAYIAAARDPVCRKMIWSGYPDRWQGTYGQCRSDRCVDRRGSRFSNTVGTIAELEPGAEVREGLSVRGGSVSDEEQNIRQWVKDNLN